jgi:hypothetical protein
MMSFIELYWPSFGYVTMKDVLGADLNVPDAGGRGLIPDDAVAAVCECRHAGRWSPSAMAERNGKILLALPPDIINICLISD